MKATEMMIRSEIRQMLNEAGLNRDSIRLIVQDAIYDIINKQVKYVLDQRPEKEIDKVVEKFMNSNMNSVLRKEVESVVKHKLQWMNFNVSVSFSNKDGE